MKFQLTFIFIFILSIGVFAQIKMERSVFSSLGTSDKGALGVESTIGEPVIGGSTGSSIRFTVGFQQAFDFTSSIVNNKEAGGIEIFPNPAKRWIQITSPIPVAQLSILDMSGKRVYHLEGRALNAEYISIESLLPGSYIFILEQKGGESTQKKIIIH